MNFLTGLLLRLATTALAFWLATLVIPGITLGTDSIGEAVLTLLLVAVIFGVVNAVLQPVIKTLGCGFYLLTLGLIAIVVNGLLFLLTSWIAGQLDLPFPSTASGRPRCSARSSSAWSPGCSAWSPTATESRR